MDQVVTSTLSVVMADYRTKYIYGRHRTYVGLQLEVGVLQHGLQNKEHIADARQAMQVVHNLERAQRMG
jgi:hypothetical protein